MRVMTILGYKAMEMALVCFIKELEDGSALVDFHKSLNTAENLSDILDRKGDQTHKPFADLSSARKYTLGLLRRLKSCQFSIVCSVNSRSTISVPVNYSQFTKVVWVDDLMYNPTTDLEADWFSPDAIPYESILDQHDQKNVTNLKSTNKTAGGSMLDALVNGVPDNDGSPIANATAALKRQPKKPAGPSDLDDFLSQLESGSLVEEEVE